MLNLMILAVLALGNGATCNHTPPAETVRIEPSSTSQAEVVKRPGHGTGGQGTVPFEDASLGSGPVAHGDIPPEVAFALGTTPLSQTAPFAVYRNGLHVFGASTAFSQIDPNAPVMGASWKTADGMTWSVNTPKKVGESVGNQAWRHAIAVKALKNEVGGPVIEPSEA